MPFPGQRQFLQSKVFSPYGLNLRIGGEIWRNLAERDSKGIGTIIDEIIPPQTTLKISKSAQ
jgi:hypothetical protein